MNRLLLTTLAGIILLAFLSTGCTPAIEQVLTTADGHTVVAVERNPDTNARKAHVFYRQTYRTTTLLTIEQLYEDGSIAPVPEGAENCLIPELGCTRQPTSIPVNPVYPFDRIEEGQ